MHSHFDQFTRRKTQISSLQIMLIEVYVRYIHIAFDFSDHNNLYLSPRLSAKKKCIFVLIYFFKNNQN